MLFSTETVDDDGEEGVGGGAVGVEAEVETVAEDNAVLAVAVASALGLSPPPSDAADDDVRERDVVAMRAAACASRLASSISCCRRCGVSRAGVCM